VGTNYGAIVYKCWSCRFVGGTLHNLLTSEKLIIIAICVFLVNINSLILFDLKIKRLT